jgi:hypothetical protein
MPMSAGTGSRSGARASLGRDAEGRIGDRSRLGGSCYATGAIALVRRWRALRRPPGSLASAPLCGGEHSPGRDETLMGH